MKDVVSLTLFSRMECELTVNLFGEFSQRRLLLKMYNAVNWVRNVCCWLRPTLLAGLLSFASYCEVLNDYDKYFCFACDGRSAFSCSGQRCERLCVKRQNKIER